MPLEEPLNYERDKGERAAKLMNEYVSSTEHVRINDKIESTTLMIHPAY